MQHATCKQGRYIFYSIQLSVYVFPEMSNDSGKQVNSPFLQRKIYANVRTICIIRWETAAIVEMPFFLPPSHVFSPCFTWRDVSRKNYIIRPCRLRFSSWCFLFPPSFIFGWVVLYRNFQYKAQKAMVAVHFILKLFASMSTDKK